MLFMIKKKHIVSIIFKCLNKYNANGSRIQETLVALIRYVTLQKPLHLLNLNSLIYKMAIKILSCILSKSSYEPEMG